MTVMEDMQREIPHMALWALLVVAFGAASGVAFAGWLRFGSDIALALGETGLSLCF
ncbi:hypothetical protein M8R20_16360 [Pseudomonas sp. R2.Fl]|nr:hypothetical protein [Pseudomonas sp. R2.Fl]